MKVIIYDDFMQAQQDCSACNILSQGTIELSGEGKHELRELPPYTTLFKKWDEDLWAMLADEKVENLLGKTAIELPDTWHKNTLE